MVRSKVTKTVPSAIAVLSGLAILLLGVSARGQTYASQQGHVLDANPRVGSMGWNTPLRLDPISRRVDLGMTGNLRYGGNFQGAVPYNSTAEFGSTLGSSTLSNFNRDSVGVADVSSRSYAIGQFAPYVDPSRQVSVLSNGNVVNTTRLYNNQIPATGRDSGIGSSYSRQPLSVQSRVYRPLNQPDFSLDVSSGINQLPASVRSAYPQLSTESLPPLHESQSLSTGLLPFLSDKTGEKKKKGLENKSSPGEQFPSADQRASTYLGLLQEPKTSDESSQPEAVSDQPSMSVPGSSSESSREPMEQKTQRLPMPQDRLIADKLRAENEKQFRQNVRKGEAYLRQGDFYKAADAFAVAAVFHPEEAVVTLARAHAAFGAGEFLTASYFLDQALTARPRLVETTVALKGMFPDPAMFERRLKDLDEWCERSGNANLLFVKGYVLAQIGQIDPAREIFKTLLQENPQWQAVTVLLQHLDGATHE